MHKVIMPKLGLTMESGKIEKWHKKEGDNIEIGDVLFEVMTDKVSIEVESYNKGILHKILRHEGDEVPITEVVAFIGEKNEDVYPPVEGGIGNDIDEKENHPIDRDKIILTEEKKEDSVLHGSKTESLPGAKRIKISPLARKLAEEQGIDIKKINGSGPKGRIIKQDILKFTIEEDKSSTKLDDTQKIQEGKKILESKSLTGIRKIIAEKMLESKSKIPHMYLEVKINVSDIIKFREQIKEEFLRKYNLKVTYTDFFIKAVAQAIEKNPEVNSSFIDQDFLIYKDININLAVASEKGLVVPTIYRCNDLSFLDIVRNRVEIVEKAREGKLTLQDISNGTFTITNLGMYGIRSSIPIINPPQAAIISIGEIYKELIFDEDKIIESSFMEITLSCDHRIIDGDTAAVFLKDLKDNIENCLTLFL